MCFSDYFQVTFSVLRTSIFLSLIIYYEIPALENIAVKLPPLQAKLYRDMNMTFQA